MVGGRRGEGGTDPRKEGGSDVKGRSAGEEGRGGTAEVVWGEGGSSGGRGIMTSVDVSAKLGADGNGMERCRRDMERQITIGNKEKIVIGEDFNASIGRGGLRRGVSGKNGLGRGNEAGRDLVDWCEEMGTGAC